CLAANLLKFPTRFEGGGECDQVDWFLACGELERLPIDALVRVPVEISYLEALGQRIVEAVVVVDDPAKRGLLGVEVVRQYARGVAHAGRSVVRYRRRVSSASGTARVTLPAADGSFVAKCASNCGTQNLKPSPMTWSSGRPAMTAGYQRSSAWPARS